MKIRLNSKDINHAIDVLNTLTTLIKDKEVELRERIANMIRTEAEFNFNGAQYNDILGQGFETVRIQVHVENKDKYSVVFTNQEEAVFVEFGAGVYYNGPAGSSPHPSGAKNAFLIGTYGYGYGKYQVWAFKGNNGDWIQTHGTPASMPLYRALQSAIPEIPRLAQMVFKGELK